MKVNIVNKSKYPLPEYATKMSAGMDLRANIKESIVLEGRGSVSIDTGISIALPEGYEAQVRPRSGLAFKNNIQASFGTIDADYRGNIMVKLFNHSDNNFIINPGDRIAQMVISKYEKAEWVEVDTLDETERGTGGLGSTGIS
jgi:dUTP pyrophosphatase